MNRLSKLVCTLSMLWIAWLLSFSFFDSSYGFVINTEDLASKSSNISRLHTLFLKGGNSTGWFIVTWGKVAISNGIVAGWNWSHSDSTWASIGWWLSNEIFTGSQNAWIAWGKSNKIGGGANSTNSFIWGWDWNKISWSNSVIVWGADNVVWNVVGWVIVGWVWNTSSGNWIALWWQRNKSNDGSLVLWKNASSSWKSFSWNSNAGYNMANINAESGILIWTTQMIEGVNLVVWWAVKLNWTAWTWWITWEIKLISWCFYAHDGLYWHIINQNSTWSCSDLLGVELSPTCRFWNIDLQQWDHVYAYSKRVASNCEDPSIKKRVVCSWWILISDDAIHSTEYTWAYCYPI